MKREKNQEKKKRKRKNLQKNKTVVDASDYPTKASKK